MIVSIVECLRTYRSPALRGWVIARLSVTEKTGTPGLVSSDRMAVITDIVPEGWLRVTLVPGGSLPLPAGVTGTAGELVISGEDLEDYLLVSGDDNPVHRGDRPILPALLLLERLLAKRQPSSPFDARFLRPAHAGQPIRLEEEKNTLTAFRSDGVVLLRILFP